MCIHNLLVPEFRFEIHFWDGCAAAKYGDFFCRVHDSFLSPTLSKLILHYYKWLIFDLFALNLNEQRSKWKWSAVKSTTAVVNVNREMRPEHEICYSFLSCVSVYSFWFLLWCLLVQSTTSTICRKIECNVCDIHEFANRKMQSIAVSQRENIDEKSTKQSKGEKLEKRVTWNFICISFHCIALWHKCINIPQWLAFENVEKFIWKINTFETIVCSSLKNVKTTTSFKPWPITVLNVSNADRHSAIFFPFFGCFELLLTLSYFGCLCPIAYRFLAMKPKIFHNRPF